MNNAKKMILGGLTLLGIVVTGYRTYELRKLKKSIEEEQIIEVQPEKIEEIKN